MKKQAQTRYNPLTGRSVIFAPKRQERPNDTKKIFKDTACPFCPNQVRPQEIIQQLPPTGLWQTAAKKNLFSALSPDNPKAYGYQEVIIDTRKHQENFADLSIKQIGLVLNLFQARSDKIKRDKKIHYILCFKNQGQTAGASLRHIHSQIFASSILPPEIIEERGRIQLYQAKNNQCPYCQLAAAEKTGPRFVWQDKNIIAFCPFASEFPYEIWLVSQRHVDNIGLLKKAEINSLAKALKLIADKLKNLEYDFNFFTHNDMDNPHQHFYLKIQPRPSIWAGVELGSGLIINQTLPEKAAKYYRQ